MMDKSESLETATTSCADETLASGEEQVQEAPANRNNGADEEPPISKSSIEDEGPDEGKKHSTSPSPQERPAEEHPDPGPAPNPGHHQEQQHQALLARLMMQQQQQQFMNPALLGGFHQNLLPRNGDLDAGRRLLLAMGGPSALAGGPHRAALNVAGGSDSALLQQLLAARSSGPFAPGGGPQPLMSDVASQSALLHPQEVLGGLGTLRGVPNQSAILAFLMHHQQQRRQMLIPGANPFGGPPGASVLNPADVPISGMGGAPAAVLREQGLSGPDNITSLSESFPVKLHRLLLDLEMQEYGTEIASFLPNGTAFAVHNPVRFESEVMRKYFPRMNRFASFQRQLNLYDFRRIAEGPARGAYYHQSFNRELPVLCRGMKRTKIKGQSAASRATGNDS